MSTPSIGNAPIPTNQIDLRSKLPHVFGAAALVASAVSIIAFVAFPQIAQMMNVYVSQPVFTAIFGVSAGIISIAISLLGIYAAKSAVITPPAAPETPPAVPTTKNESLVAAPETPAAPAPAAPESLEETKPLLPASEPAANQNTKAEPAENGSVRTQSGIIHTITSFCKEIAALFGQ